MWTRGCGDAHFPFAVEGPHEGHGTFVATGVVVRTTENATWDPAEAPYYYQDIRLRVAENQDAWFAYYKGMAQSGNSINRYGDDGLEFKLGAIDKGAFTTTAMISGDAKARVLSSLETGAPVTLSITVPLRDGSGVPFDFSFACDIELGSR
jgi:hypothetical protein